MLPGLHDPLQQKGPWQRSSNCDKPKKTRKKKSNFKCLQKQKTKKLNNLNLLRFQWCLFFSLVGKGAPPSGEPLM